jgi:hypothetical protein
MKRELKRKLLSRLSKEVAPYVMSQLRDVLISNLEEHLQQEILPKIRESTIELATQKVHSALEPLPDLVNKIISQSLPQQLSIIDDFLTSKMTNIRDIKHDVYVPNNILTKIPSPNYLVSSNPIARDYFDPRFEEFCKIYHHPLTIHRKLWEFAFIYHRLNEAGVLQQGMRGLGFGVGSEKLPSVFASRGAQITATDAPSDSGGWEPTGQYAGSREGLYFPDVITRESFDDLVCYESCDMNDIPSSFHDYDFCWSACALEHLGNLQNGIDFIIASLETLKIGGIACHTTELNLSSDTDTVDTGTTVIYRRQDLERLIKTLEERGHWVEPLRIEPGDLPPDYLVDVPPTQEICT